MKFMLLYPNDEMAMARLPQEEIDRIVAEKTKVGQELFAQGKEIVGARLWPTALATRVTMTGGKHVATDGPFTETKEVLGGFNLIECGSREEAVEWAKRMAVFESSVVEVRTVWDRCLCHGSYTCSSRV